MLWAGTRQIGQLVCLAKYVAEQEVQRHMWPQGTIATLELLSWQTTQRLGLDLDSLALSRAARASLCAFINFLINFLYIS